MAIQDKLNLTMLCDFYELTMSNGYFEKGYKDRICYFDVFFRQCPDNGGFAIAAGLEQIVDYIQNLHFTPEDIRYLRDRKLFSAPNATSKRCQTRREKESSTSASMASERKSASIEKSASFGRSKVFTSSSTGSRRLTAWVIAP